MSFCLANRNWAWTFDLLVHNRNTALRLIFWHLSRHRASYSVTWHLSNCQLVTFKSRDDWIGVFLLFRNWEASDMWSFAILLWELATREVPFPDQSPMEVGMRIALEGLRISLKPGISSHLAKLIKICMNEDPGKRPKFDMVLPILDKMTRWLVSYFRFSDVSGKENWNLTFV